MHDLAGRRARETTRTAYVQRLGESHAVVADSNRFGKLAEFDEARDEPSQS
jgi:hypothetical protein